MKRCIFFILLFCIATFSLFHTEHKKNTESALYNILSKENFGPFDKEKCLYIIAGIDYIPSELIQLFESITGIEVITDIFDSNEILEVKLLSGMTKYDIVFPTAWPNFSRQLKAGIYQKLDKSKIDTSIFDEDILKRLAEYDENNNHGLPFQFGIQGIGINEEIVNELIGGSKKDTYALIFDPSNAKKLSKYGISLYESPNELFPAVLAYLGLNPETENENDIIKAAEHLKKIRPYISKFTSYGFEDMASKNACVTLGTSGDMFMVSKENPSIKFLYPIEGASLWIDVVAIPAQAKHTNNIYAFFKFLFHPMIIAEFTNITFRANAVTKSVKYVNESIKNNHDIYPDKSIRKRCYVEKPVPATLEALKTRLLTKIKSMDK